MKQRNGRYIAAWLQNWITTGRVLLVIIGIVLFAVIGVRLLQGSQAATDFVDKEPEKGTVLAPAEVVGDNNASGDKAVRFKPAGPLPPKIADVSYGSHRLQKMDIHPSTDGQVRPAVLMVHGGGWNGGDKVGMDPESKQLAAAGFTVFNVNYRLPAEDEPGYPMEVDDMKAAVRWVVANGGNYRADPTAIHMIGGSAGGHLVALSAGMLSIETPGIVRSVVSLSGAMDFTLPYDPEVDGGAIGVENLLGCDVVTECSDELLAETSPVTYVGPVYPPTYLMHSLNEQADQRQAQSMYDRLLGAGRDVKLRWLPGEAHAFAFWSTVDVSVVKWLNEH